MFSLTTAAIALLASGHCELNFRKSQRLERGLEAYFQSSGLAFRASTHSSEVYATAIRKPTCLQGASLSLLTSCLWQEGPDKGSRIAFGCSVQNTVGIQQHQSHRNICSNTYMWHSNSSLPFIEVIVCIPLFSLIIISQQELVK